jgi:LmbE family N-acetylglucosaminyl deacetylase
MRLQKFIALFAILYVLLFTGAHIVYVYSFSPREKKPNDIFLTESKLKKALAIVAHDDDLAVFAGTFAYLRESGWEVEYVSFYRGKNDELENLRKNELKKVADLQGFSKLRIIDFQFLQNPDVELTYMPIPYSKFETHFKMDSLRQIIREVILTSKPSVIFSLDDIIGGYGHSEHVIVGQCIVKMCRQLKAEGLWDVNKIYQGVYPASQEKAVNKNLKVYQEALKVYQVDGMPDPDVQIQVKKYHREKMKVIKTYASQHKNLKKFAVYHHYYPSWIYFRIFSREFFKVLEV